MMIQLKLNLKTFMKIIIIIGIYYNKTILRPGILYNSVLNTDSLEMFRKCTYYHAYIRRII